MSKTVTTIIFKCICLIVLSGCANQNELNVFRDRSDEYKKARVQPILEVPKGVRAEPFNDMYQIP